MHAVTRPLAPRSPRWHAVRAEHLAREPMCMACAGVVFLEVHHIRPFHLFPELELADSNLITLCEGPCNCHLAFGHLHNWASYNPGVRLDVAAYLFKVQHRLSA